MKKVKNTQKPDADTQLWETYKKAEPYLGLGVTFTVSILAFLFLGRWLDSKFGTEPWFMIIGAAIGLILGFVHLIYTLNELLDDNTDGKQPK